MGQLRLKSGLLSRDYKEHQNRWNEADRVKWQLLKTLRKLIDGDLEKGRTMPERTIEQVQEEHTDDWMAIPGVEGTAIGLYEGKPCIKIFTSKKPHEIRAKIPSTVEGYPVIIEETGAFRALEPE